MSNTSQDGRETQSMLDTTNVTVYITYVSNAFQWGLSPVNLQPLSSTINVQSSSSVRFEFLRSGQTSIWYKLPPSNPTPEELPTSSGPTTVVSPGNRAQIAVATSSGGTYYTGSVTVSDDGLDDFAPGGGSGDEPTE